MYIETVIDIHKKFLVLVQEAFAGEQGFTAALDKVEQKKNENDTLQSLFVCFSYRHAENLLIIMQ